MAKVNQKGKAPEPVKTTTTNKTFMISLITFAVLVTGCISYLMWEKATTKQYSCLVLGVDQVVGLVALDCVKK